MKTHGTVILFLQCHGRKRNTFSEASRTQAPTIQHSFYLPALPGKVDITVKPWNSERLKTKIGLEARDAAQLGECLPNMHKAQSVPSLSH